MTMVISPNVAKKFLYNVLITAFVLTTIGGCVKIYTLHYTMEMIFVTSNGTRSSVELADTDFFCKAGRNSFLYKLLSTCVYILFPPFWLLAFLGCGLYGRYFKNPVTSAFNRYFLPPVAVLTVFLLAFKANGIYPFGKKTIAWCDLTQQGVPYWMNFKSVIEGDGDLFLNMYNAGGMNGWSLVRGLLFSPFSYIALFIERQSMMDVVTVLQIIKFAACSVTAMVFFKVCCKKLNPSISVALSMMYSFCAYGLMYYQIITWPDAMCVAPLYFTGVYLLVTKYKITMFAVSLYLVMNNFPFGFMTVLATLMFMGYYFVTNGRDKEHNNKVAFCFVAGAFIGALLSAFTWLVFFNTYGASSRGVNISDNIKAKGLLTSKNTVYPLLMSTAFVSVAVLSLKGKLRNPIHKSLFFVFGMMLLPMFFEPINLMWHAGSYMAFPARYAYILTFVGLALAGILLSDINFGQGELERTSFYNSRNATNKVVLNISAGALLSIIGFYVIKVTFSIVDKHIKKLDNYSTTLWGNDDSYTYTLIVFAFFVILYAIGYLFYKHRIISKQVFAAFLMAVLIFEATCAIKIYVVPPTSKVDSEDFRLYADLSDRIDDDDFYRVKNEKFLDAAYSISEANFPGAIGYNSMGHYSSLVSETYLYLAKALGYSSMWTKIESFGGTKFSDALMCVKYGIDKKTIELGDGVYENSRYQINEKEYYMPLGLFTSADDISVDLMEVERIELQEMIYDALSGGTSNLFVKQNFSTSNCKVVDKEKSGNDKYIITPSASGDAYIYYSVNVRGTQTLYLDCFDEFSNDLSEKINGSFCVYVNGARVNSSYPSSSNNGILNLGTFTDTIVSVSLKVLEKVECRSFGVYTMNESALSKLVKNIDSASLTVDGNDIRGEYFADEDGYVLVSVPNIVDYMCVVNGKRIAVESAFGGFISVPVKAGENKICLTYTPPMFYGALILVLCGLALGITVLVIIKKKKVSGFYALVEGLVGERNISKISAVFKYCTLAAFGLVIFAIYLWPMLTKLSNHF